MDVDVDTDEADELEEGEMREHGSGAAGMGRGGAREGQRGGEAVEEGEWREGRDDAMREGGGNEEEEEEEGEWPISAEREKPREKMVPNHAPAPGGPGKEHPQVSLAFFIFFFW